MWLVHKTLAVSLLGLKGPAPPLQVSLKALPCQALIFPCKCVIYWAAWLCRVPAYSGAVSSIARHKSDIEIQRGGEMLALRSQWEPRENVCIPLSSWAVYICDSFFTYFALMVMVLLGKHLHGLEVSCLQDPGGLGGLLPPASRTMALLWSEAWSSDMLHFRKQEDRSYKSAEGLTAMNL